MSDTPICYANRMCRDYSEFVPFHVAQKLERENAKLRKALEQARRELMAHGHAENVISAALAVVDQALST